MELTCAQVATPTLRLRGILPVAARFAIGVLALAIVDVARMTIGRTGWGTALLVRFGARLAGLAGPAAAVRTACRTRRSVPAYREATAGARPWRRAFATGRLAGYLEALPVLDKQNYVDRYPLAERCRDGQLSSTGVEIDESSGSSGRPYQWVRSRRELDEVERGLAMQATLALRDRAHERVVVLNCFSMGAWATGASVTGALKHVGVIKSCGPDVDKALAAIDLLGGDACYVICGYPPFLATLLDAANARGLDLSELELWGFVGGEGMTEVFRTRLERIYRRVLSAYGASDLDIGVAGETDLAITLRQAAVANPDLAQALFGGTGRVPMLFQYDPSGYYVESVDGHLVVTVNRRLLSPRVRYSVKDAGASIDFRAAVAIAREHGVELPTRNAARLPFLFVAGRADSTLSHMGANLYPEDVDAALGTLAEQHPQYGVGSFCLELVECADGSTKPRIHVEALDAGAGATVAAGIAGWLVAHNRDWAAVADEQPRALDFDVRLTEPGTGVFAVNATRIKRRYVLN